MSAVSTTSNELLRYQAIELALRSKPIGSSPRDITSTAEEFFKFLTKDSAGDKVADDGTDKLPF